MKRGSPGGLLSVLSAPALSLCLIGESSAADVVPLCVASELQRSFGAGCAVSLDANGDSKFELNATASDHGFFWSSDGAPGGSDQLALTSEPQIDRSITFQVNRLTTGLGELDLHGGVGTTKSSDALTFQRLRWGDNARQDNT